MQLPFTEAWTIHQSKVCMCVCVCVCVRVRACVKLARRNACLSNLSVVTPPKFAAAYRPLSFPRRNASFVAVATLSAHAVLRVLFLHACCFWCCHCWYCCCCWFYGAAAVVAAAARRWQWCIVATAAVTAAVATGLPGSRVPGLNQNRDKTNTKTIVKHIKAIIKPIKTFTTQMKTIIQPIKIIIKPINTIIKPT